MTTLETARLELRAAREKFEAFLKTRWPLGSDVKWTMREHIQYGEVVGHSGENLRVRNIFTGKTYWVDSYFLIDGKRK